MAEIETIHVDGKRLEVPSGITVKKALALSGYRVTMFPEKDALFAPCGVGGCWSCAVLIDGEPAPAAGKVSTVFLKTFICLIFYNVNNHGSVF